MNLHSRVFRICAALLIAVVALLGQPHKAVAGTTGILSGTVRDASTNAPLANAHVTAVSPSGKGSAVTDAKGFYSIANLAPDTYTVNFSTSGFDDRSVSGVTVFQDQNYTLDQTLTKKSLKEIGAVTSRSGSNLVQPGQTADVYNLSSRQLDAAQGGDNVHKTLYNYLQSVPGVTATGANGAPRIRGGTVTALSYEYDGIPINDRLTGLFTTNLANIGVNSVELYTGGYNAKYGNATQGVINNVIKRGTYPGFGFVSTALTSHNFGHFLSFEYGTATPDNRLSAYIGFDGTNTINTFAHEEYSYPLVTLFGVSALAGNVYTRDLVGNFHYKPTTRDDIQLLVQNGYGVFNFNYLLSGTQPVGVIPCAGYKGTPGTAGGGNFTVTVPGTSVTGQPCNDPGSGAPSGLQYVLLDGEKGNVWYHYSGLGKIQWNHVFNDKLSGSFRIAENFNQYIFDQPYDDPNIPGTYPYCGQKPGGCKTGDPASGSGNDNGSEDFYGDRRSNIYLASADFNYIPTAHSTYYGGLGYERDISAQNYYDREGTNSVGGSAFDINGNWPNNYLTVNYPLTLPYGYVGTTQKIGKFTIEPSLRYDAETYHLPVGDYGVHAWSPRFSMSYAASRNTVLRGSYTNTTTFVPAAYVYNASVDGTNAANFRNENPFLPGAAAAPELDHNVDFSYEQQLNDGQTSFRITPYYHVSNNIFGFFRNYTIDANGNVKFSGPSIAKSNGVSKNFGIELGVNHVLPQYANGLSWYLAATYQNALSSSQNLFSAVSNNSAGGSRPADFLKNRTLYKVSGNVPLSVSFTGDYRYNHWHFQPFVLYQCCGYYNVFGNTTYGLLNPDGTAVMIPNPAKPGKFMQAMATDTTVHQAPAYFYSHVTLAYDFGNWKAQRHTTLGLNVENLFDTLRGTTPAANGFYGNPNHYGEFSDYYIRYRPGVVPYTLYGFEPTAQNPRSFELFLTTHY